MRIVAIGIGGGGNRIVDDFVSCNPATIQAAIAVDASQSTLKDLDHVPNKRRALVGTSRVYGNGAGCDNDIGAELVAADIDLVQECLDTTPVYEADAVVVVAGLGGGTGSGGAPVLAQHLNRLYELPVYGVGILPGSFENDPRTLNAARSLQTFVREADNLLLFDNDVWIAPDKKYESQYDSANKELIKRMVAIFDGSAEHREDSKFSLTNQDVIDTLSSGGISTIGYASETVELPSNGLISRVFGGNDDDSTDDADATNRITSLVRKAALETLTLECNVECVHTLLACSGPPEHLSDKGVIRGLKWLEQANDGNVFSDSSEPKTNGTVFSGSFSVPGREVVTCATLFSGLQGVPRIKEIQQVAIEAQEAATQSNSETDQASTPEHESTDTQIFDPAERAETQTSFRSESESTDTRVFSSDHSDETDIFEPDQAEHDK